MIQSVYKNIITNYSKLTLLVLLILLSTFGYFSKDFRLDASSDTLLLENDPDLNFDYLSHITGADYLNEDREPRFEVVYELHSIDKNHSIRIRVGLEEEDPTVPTVSDLWKGALYPERELFDMFGFNVTGHPNLSRLIMPEEWEGNPLRKDYPLTIEDVTFSHNREFKQDLVKSKPATR